MKRSFHCSLHELLQFHHLQLFIHQQEECELHQLIKEYQSLVHLRTYEVKLRKEVNFQDVVNQSKSNNEKFIKKEKLNST